MCREKCKNAVKMLRYPHFAVSRICKVGIGGNANEFVCDFFVVGERETLIHAFTKLLQQTGLRTHCTMCVFGVPHFFYDCNSLFYCFYIG